MLTPDHGRFDPSLRGALAELRELEDRILRGLAEASPEQLEAYGSEREQRLVAICEALAALDDEVLRRDTLLALAEANRQIEAAATVALDATIALSKQSTRQRRAISAYDDIDNDGG